ncbi:serine hydrolase-domain-containing protein [Leptodontidium sp. MPI-SDFR-AT-0119]|nr:serine hydrolase-domain-containing protein [Leptodontidium sp. MPI-SDFR-AT-0119]
MPTLRFLCLHGAGTNSDIFRLQLDPISEELRKDNSATFHFIDGEEDSGPGPGIEGLFEGPYFSFYAWPRTCTSEDEKAVEEAYKLIYATIEQEGPFDGILGFSQGATLAFQFLSQHAKRFPYDLPNAVFRCGVFICGPPPFRVISGKPNFPLSKARYRKLITPVPLAGMDAILYSEQAANPSFTSGVIIAVILGRHLRLLNQYQIMDVSGLVEQLECTSYIVAKL